MDKPCKNGHFSERDKFGKCPECKRISSARFRKEQPERRKANVAKYLKTDKKKAASKRSYYKDLEKSRERCREYARKFRKNNPERAKELSRKQYWKNPEKARAVSRERSRKNRDQIYALNHKYRAQKRGAKGKFTADDVIRIYKLQKGRCAICKVKLNNIFDRDHIMPLSKGGTNEPKNIQLLCGPCNSSKHDADPIEFMQRRGLLC